MAYPLGKGRSIQLSYEGVHGTGDPSAEVILIERDADKNASKTVEPSLVQYWIIECTGVLFNFSRPFRKVNSMRKAASIT